MASKRAPSFTTTMVRLARVSVRRLAGTIALAVNGTVDASNTRDMLRQTMLAHLPLLLHAAPSDICIIGLGSGVTAGAALAHPVDRVDTIKLVARSGAGVRFLHHRGIAPRCAIRADTCWSAMAARICGSRAAPTT